MVPSLEDCVKMAVAQLRSKTIIADTATAGTFALGRAALRGIRDKSLYDIPFDITSRILYIVGETLLGRPYGAFRDYLFSRYATKESSSLRKAVLDVAANAAFYPPLNAATLYIAGATDQQILLACGTALVTSAIVGRPYGIYLEHMRRWLGAENKKRS